jgi:hypothetical protein
MMYQMKSIRQILAVAFLLATGWLHSCDYLNVSDYFEETLKYDSIFTSKRNIERYLWATAASLPNEGAVIGNNYTPGPMATDEAFCLYATGEFRGIGYVLGEVTTTNGLGMDNWGTLYVIIRKCNTIMARMNEAPDMTTLDRREMLGYTIFIRAYAYYHLLMKYGPVVNVGDEPMETNEGTEYYDRARDTYDESVNYICAELERAAEYMPATVLVSFFGRPSQAAAYGLIARLRLQQASPLYNGQSAARTYFGEWKRSTDGVHYVSQTYDESKWAVAAMASKRIINLGTFALHTVPRAADTYPLPASVSANNFPYGAGDIDPFRSYADMFNGEVLPQRNPEFIWAEMSATTRDYTRHAFPVTTMGGWNGLGVTQKVIDAYYMVDGKTIHDSSAEYPYQTTGFKGSESSFSQYRLLSSVSNMYVNREMRFYASIGFSDWLIPANTCTDPANAKNYTATYYSNGNSGKTQTDANVNNYPITGYVLRKYVHSDDAWTGTGATRLEKAFPIIRYAEILLSYAEALNNLTTTHTITDESGMSYTLSRDVAEIRSAFDQVRFRAGLPGLTDAELASPETIQALIEKERMIEFLYEDRRYFDVRRWGIYEITEREPIMGMNTDAPRASYYTPVPVNHSRARNRLVDRKLVFMPINLAETRKSPSLDQNPGW